MRNTKGVAFNAVDWFLKFFFLFITVSATIFLIRYSLNVTIETQESRVTQFTERVLYSPYGIIYLDSATNQPQPWTIDLNRFTTKNLEQAVRPNQHDLIAARLDLILSEDDRRTAYFNQGLYEQWKQSIHTGSQAVVDKSVSVLVYDPLTSTKKQATLLLSIITPRG